MDADYSFRNALMRDSGVARSRSRVAIVGGGIRPRQARCGAAAIEYAIDNPGAEPPARGSGRHQSRGASRRRWAHRRVRGSPVSIDISPKNPACGGRRDFLTWGFGDDAHLSVEHDEHRLARVTLFHDALAGANRCSRRTWWQSTGDRHP